MTYLFPLYGYVYFKLTLLGLGYMEKRLLEIYGKNYRNEIPEVDGLGFYKMTLQDVIYIFGCAPIPLAELFDGKFILSSGDIQSG